MILQDSLSEPVLQGSLSKPVLQDELLLRCDDLADDDINGTTRQKMVSFIIIIQLYIYILKLLLSTLLLNYFYIQQMIRKQLLMYACSLYI